MKLENLEDIYELSPMQQGMLFHSLSAPESGVYIELFSCGLRGNLNTIAFKLAWQQILEQHPVWRTSFYWENLDKPVQVVNRQMSLPWEQHDWRELSTQQQQEQLETLLQAEQKRGFVLSQAPLMRLYLIQLAEKSYQFIWSYHHLLLDGWSVSLVFKEVFAFYEAFSRGQDLHLEPSRPYRDYITWLQEQDLASAETFWRQTLKGFTAPTLVGINTAVPGRVSETNTCEHQQIQLSAAATAALSSLARKHQLTLNTIVQGAWALLLSRYSSQTDVVFGATVSGRPSTLPGVESMVGLFINTLPVRVQVSPDTELASWLKQVQAQQVELRQYEYSPLVQVQSWSEVPRGLPLFESIIVFENYPVDASLEQDSSGLEIINVHSVELTNYPLTLVAVPSRELLFRFIYDVRRFDTATITRMLGHFQTLLESIAVDPQQRLMDLSLLTVPERQQLLVEWNDQNVNYPNDRKCVHQLFETQVELTPRAVAVVYEDQILTYSELNSRANCVAHYLHSLGVRPETLVGIYAERSLDMVVGILGILKAGGAYVPLDPRLPQERLAWMLEDSQVPVLLTQQQLVAGLPAYTGKIVYLDTDFDISNQEYTENLQTTVTDQNLVYAIYTSGSTGKPKGVLVDHKSLLNLIFWHQSAFGVTFSDRATQLAGIAFDASVWELWPYLTVGASIYLVKSEIVASPIDLQKWLVSHQISISFLPAPLIENLLTIEWPENTALRILLSGADKLHQYPPTSLPFKLVNTYGPTENTVVTTSGQVVPNEQDDISPAIGQPIANTQVYLLDQYLQLVPVGVPGELYIGGSGLARGYLNRPELNALKFIPNPFSNKPGARLYKTGDLVRYLNDGSIQFLGRSDDQVKIRGFRIELGEIEAGR